MRLIFAFRKQCNETNVKLQEFHNMIRNQLTVEGLAHRSIESSEVSAVECVQSPNSIEMNKDSNDSEGHSTFQTSKNSKLIEQKNSITNMINSTTIENDGVKRSKNRVEKPSQNSDYRKIANSTENKCHSSTSERSNDFANKEETITDLCAHCGISFADSSDYARHMLTKHGLGTRSV